MLEQLSRLKSALSPRYSLESEIGRGGMATVYLATDERLGRKVAVKVLHPELASGITAHRFQREITIAAGLSHRHLVPVHDCGEAEGLLYFVMPFVEGETLRSALDREGPFDLERTVAVARNVAEGLAYAHERGFVHRDIKPQNILLTGGYAVVTDFGVCRALELAGGETLTSEGMMIGTPAYMSPEQAGGQLDIGARSDEYSLACVVYEMLSGTPPFEGGSYRKLVVQQLQETVPSLRSDLPDLPRSVDHVIRRALSKVPDRRFETILEFVEKLDQAVTGEYRRPARDRLASTWRRPLVRRLSFAALVAAAAIPVQSLLLRGAPAFEGRPVSAVVLPFVSSDEADAKISADLAHALTRQLNRWESVQVVPSVSLAGAAFDLGLEPRAMRHVDDGVRVAREFGVEALIAVTALTVGDTAFVEATLFDPSRARQVGQPLLARGPADRITAIADELARGILALEGDPLSLDDLYRASSSPGALRQEASAVRALESWQLDEAERGFRAAIALDSSFAMARHGLALTLYWQSARAPERLGALGPQIAEASAEALRFSAGLPARDSLHIRAFFDFQLGEYEEARQRYRSLLASDSTDVYAWLMLGSTEFRDHWLAPTRDGMLRPRRNDNAALAAFSEAVRLQPTFHLGYGHIFDIHQQLSVAIDRPRCSGFRPPGLPPLAPWEPGVPDRLISFCAAVLDSIVWLSRSEIDTIPELARERGANSILDAGLALVRRWAAYAPTNPQPREELVGMALRELRRQAVDDPARIDSLIAVAMEHAAAGLQLRADTSTIDLVQLGLLNLASGQREHAVTLVERGLARATPADSAAIATAANLFMALGQPVRATELIGFDPTRRFARDETTGTMIPWAAGLPRVNRLRVLGASGLSGPPITRELTALIDAWSSPRYSASQRQVLYAQATAFLTIGLAFDPEALDLWAGATTDESPLWRALAAAANDQTAAAAHLDRVIAEGSPRFGSAVAAFLTGVIADRVDRTEASLQFFARLDSIQPGFLGPDVAWALRPVSWYLRGRAAESLGRGSEAVDYYSRFVAQWSGADSTAMPLVVDSTERLERLGEP